MKVCIEDNLYIESDGMQFILKEYNGKKDKLGNDLFKTHGYFPTVASALNHVVKMKVMNSDASTLSELLTEVKGIREYIESKVTA